LGGKGEGGERFGGGAVREKRNPKKRAGLKNTAKKSGHKREEGWERLEERGEGAEGSDP